MIIAPVYRSSSKGIVAIALLVTGLALVGCDSHSNGSASANGATLPASNAGTLTDADALRAMFGNYDASTGTAKWSGIDTTDPFLYGFSQRSSTGNCTQDFGREAVVKSAFSAEYADGIGKARVVITRAVSSTLAKSHSPCLTIMSAGIFREKGGKWELVNKRLNAGWLPEPEADLKLEWVEVSPAHHALLARAGFGDRLSPEYAVSYRLFDIDSDQQLVAWDMDFPQRGEPPARRVRVVKFVPEIHDGWYDVYWTSDRVDETGAPLPGDKERHHVGQGYHYYKAQGMYGMIQKKIVLDEAQAYAEQVLLRFRSSPECDAMAERIRSVANLGGTSQLRIAQLMQFADAAERIKCVEP